MKLFTMTRKEYNIGAVKQLSETVVRVITNIMNKESSRLAVYVRQSFLSGPTSDITLSKRSGELRKKTNPYPVKVMSDMVVGGIIFGDGLSYTSVHINQVGTVTTIKPRTAQALAIPLPGAMDKSGNVQNRYRSGLRGIKGLFRPYVSGSKGEKRRADYLAIKRGGQIIPMFKLRKSVNIKSRVFPEVIAAEQEATVRHTFEAAVNNYINRNLSK